MSSDEHVRNYVESSDLVLMLGTFITDMSMGFYTAKLDRRRTILATSERTSIQYHRYDSIQFRDFLEALAAANIKPKPFKHPNRNALPKPLKNGERCRPLTMVDVFRTLSLHLDERCCLIADIGDAILARSVFAVRDKRNSSRPHITCRWVSPCRPASASQWPPPACGPMFWSATARSR
jgi:TPP-dependent 2-oxoacid decarboxylase